MPRVSKGLFQVQKTLFFSVLGLKCPFSLHVCASVKLLWYQMKLGCKEWMDE